MIKQAAPQHPQGLTKLQHRLLYESDSDSSFDLTFSSPSSIGSTSEYSDVGYQSSARSRTSSHTNSRRMGGHASRSESFSSVLGSSIAIQRVLMGTNPPASSSRKSQRQSVRAIANAFEQAGRAGTMRAPTKIASQFDRVPEEAAPVKSVPTAPLGARKVLNEKRNAQPFSIDAAAAAGPSSAQASQSNDSYLGRSKGTHGPVPARLRISKEALKGPLSAPATITTGLSRFSTLQSGIGDPSQQETQFVFPPRSSVQKRWPYDESNPRVRSFISLDGLCDDDEPAFDIVPSPSRRRNFPLPNAAAPTIAPVEHVEATPRASQSGIESGRASIVDSPTLRSSHSAASRDSLDSTYSLDSLSGHPFSLQLPDRDPRASSSASMLDLDELDNFTSPFIGASSTGFMNPPGDADEVFISGHQPARTSLSNPTAPVEERASARASTSTLQPLLLSISRPSSSSSSSTSTLTPSAQVQAPVSMRVNEDATFPLPPFTTRAALPTTKTTFSRLASSISDKFARKEPTRDIAVPTRALDLGSESGADQSLAIAELKREAQALLDSIRELGDELDSSIPPTHRLPGSGHRAPSAKSNCTSPASVSNSSGGEEEERASFVAVDESYSDVWRLMDAWYWSSFEVGPSTSTSI